MMTDEPNKYDLDDLLNSAVAQKPIEFEAAFSDLVIDRIRDAVENKKIEIAQQMYGYEPPEEFETDDNDNEFGASDEQLGNSEEEEDGEVS